MNDNSSAILALSLDRLPFRINPIIENMHSTEDALLLRTTAAKIALVLQSLHILPEYEWVAI